MYVMYMRGRNGKSNFIDRAGERNTLEFLQDISHLPMPLMTEFPPVHFSTMQIVESIRTYFEGIIIEKLFAALRTEFTSSEFA